MCEELRELGSLHDESFYIPQHIVTQALYDLGNVEESDINRMRLQSTNGILDDTRVIAKCWQEVSNSCDWIDRRPKDEILMVVSVGPG